ncbi:hypothetical protein HDU93_005837 [Gonapodya sp. JEL0774]|nr:hypothetical protein HDU93_005837 [Gonapodya sp. JEL0774]
MAGGPRPKKNNGKAARAKKAAFRSRSKATTARATAAIEDAKPKIPVRAGRVVKAGVAIRPTELSKKKVKKMEQRKKLITRHLEEIGMVKKKEDVDMADAPSAASAGKEV